MKTIPDWGSVIHVTIGENGQDIGDKTPEIRFLPHSDVPEVCVPPFQGKSVYKCQTLTSGLILQEYTKVQIYQNETKAHIGEYSYIIMVNNAVVLHSIHANPRKFRDVKIYASNPWINPAAAYIKNFVFNVN